MLRRRVSILSFGLPILLVLAGATIMAAEPASEPQSVLLQDDDDDDGDDDDSGDDDDDGDDDDEDDDNDVADDNDEQTIRRDFWLDAFIQDVASDCRSVDVATAIIYATDDGGEVDQYRIRIFDGGSTLLLHEYEALILRSRDPVFVNTGPIPAEATPSQGLYRIEVWDWNNSGNPVGPIDQVFHQCTNDDSWRIEPFNGFFDDDDDADDNDNDGDDDNDDEMNDEDDNDGGEDDDFSDIQNSWAVRQYRCPLEFSSGDSTAPRDGVVMVTRFDGGENRQYHVATMPVLEGQFFGATFSVPCGRFIRTYFQPLGNNLPPVPPESVFRMPSQFGLEAEYGMPGSDEYVYNDEVPDPAVYTFAFPTVEEVDTVLNSLFGVAPIEAVPGATDEPLPIEPGVSVE